MGSWIVQRLFKMCFMIKVEITTILIELWAYYLLLFTIFSSCIGNPCDHVTSMDQSGSVISEFCCVCAAALGGGAAAIVVANVKVQCIISELWRSRNPIWFALNCLSCYVSISGVMKWRKGVGAAHYWLWPGPFDGAAWPLKRKFVRLSIAMDGSVCIECSIINSQSVWELCTR